MGSQEINNSCQKIKNETTVFGPFSDKMADIGPFWDKITDIL